MKKIEPKNFIDTLKENKFFKENDLFSLDIDSYDYWVLKELPKNFCKIIVAEFNPYFGDKLEISVPFDKNFNRTNYHFSNLCFGASLKAIISLLREKNFEFIGTNLFRNNAFFINFDYRNSLSLNFPKRDNLKIYTDAKFRESRDKNNNLNLVDPERVLLEIQDCEVVDLSKKSQNLTKIKDLISSKD